MKPSFRRPRRAHPLVVEPGTGVERIGDSRWNAIDQPAELTVADLGPDRGWLRVRFRYERLKGRPVAPILRFWTPANRLPARIRLGRDRRDRVDQIVFLDHDAYDVTIELPGAQGWFVLADVRIQALSRTAAMTRMGLAVAAHQARPRALVTGVRRARGHLRAGGIGGLRRRVLQRYLAREARATDQAGTISYDDWIDVFGTIDDRDRSLMRRAIEGWPSPPTFSVIVPVYDPDERWLRAAIESVRSQTYPHWQLCLADDASPRPHVRRVLEEYASVDDRIVVAFRNENGHIAAASNTALDLATGDWIALLDHDDELAEHALFTMAAEIVAHPDAALVYSDEDKIDASRHRQDPHFKPGWNPDQFLAQNYLSHLTVIRRDLVDKAGDFRVGYEGSQDYDLFLRVSELVDPIQIRHVPHVLYHWRAVAGSTALSTAEKDYAEEAARRALSDHLRRRGVDATVEAGLAPTAYRIRYRLPDPPPLVSVLVPTRNQLPLLQRCVEGVLHETDYPRMELVVIDNRSDDPATLAYLDGLDHLDGVTVLRHDADFNYAAINNEAAAASSGDILLLLNNDVEIIHPDWMTELAAQAWRSEIGAVGAKLRYPDGTIQHGGVVIGIGGVGGHGHKYFPADAHGYFSRLSVAHDIGAVTGACLATRRAVWTEVGGLDAEELRVAFNDVDYCLKVRRAGYRVLWTPHAELYHHESKSRGLDDTPEKLERLAREADVMERRWGASLLEDPSYNPNLTLERENFAITDSPRATPPWVRG